MRRTIGYALCAITLCLGNWGSLAGAADATEKPAVEQILDILLQRGQITPEEYRSLQEQAQQEHAAGAKKSSATVLAGIEKGKPFLKSADEQFRLELGGRLQADFDATEADTRTLTGASLGSQALVRRARLEASGSFFKWITFRIEGDFTQSPSLVDAYLEFRLVPELSVRAGQFKAPFSLEELTSDLHIDFVERSIVNALVPSYDIGAMASGTFAQGAVNYFLGVFNGTGQNRADNNGDKDLAFRLVFAPFRTSDSLWLKGLQLAGNVTWGNESSATSPAGQTGARTPNRFTFFAAQPTVGERLRYGGDLAWLVGPASVKFEYDVQQNTRDRLGPGGSNLDDVVATGWYVSATYILTGEAKPLNGPVVPRHPFLPWPGQMGPGAWEVGIRYAELDFDSDSPVNFFNGNLAQIPGGQTTATNGAQALTAGVNWYLNERVRLMFNWTQYWYDNALGTPFSCSIGSCNAAALHSGDKSSWEILSRIQLWF
jgi:phosphate-selective porin OprO and OprP